MTFLNLKDGNFIYMHPDVYMAYETQLLLHL